MQQNKYLLEEKPGKLLLKKALRIYLMLILFTLVQKICSIFLQSIDHPAKATVLSLIRDVISFVPLTVLLPLSFGLDGVLWAEPISDVFGLIFSVLFVTIAFGKMKKQNETNNQSA